MRAKQARPGQQKRATVPSRRVGRRKREVETVQVAANSYCLRQYGIRCSGGTPRCLALRGSDVWIVPIIFTSPGYGPVGEVGLVAIDAATHEVAGATPREEARAAVARLAEEKRNELEAALPQARKA
jgi:hypothetical protein